MGKTIFYTSAEPKLLYQSLPNFERMITSVKQTELSNLVVMGSMEVAPHVGEVYSYILGFFFTFFFFFFFFFLFRQLTYRPQFATDFDV
jgi:hypothetical protein